MTANEKHILRQGILKFGHAICSAFAYLFPYIPNPLLRLAWEELYQIGSVPIQWIEPDRPPTKMVQQNIDIVPEINGPSNHQHVNEMGIHVNGKNEFDFGELFGTTENNPPPQQSLFDHYFGNDVLDDLDMVGSNNPLLPSSEWDPSFLASEPMLESDFGNDFGNDHYDDFVNTPSNELLPIQDADEQIEQFFDFNDSEIENKNTAGNKFSPDKSRTPTQSPPSLRNSPLVASIPSRRKKKSNPKQVILNRNHTPIKKRKLKLLKGMQDINTKSDAESSCGGSPMSSLYRCESETPMSYQDEATPAFSIADSEHDLVFGVRKKKSTPKRVVKLNTTPILMPERSKRERTESLDNTTPKKRRREMSTMSPKPLPNVQFANLYDLASTDDEDRDYHQKTIPEIKVEPLEVMEANQKLPLGKNGRGKRKNRPISDKISPNVTILIRLV